MPERILNEFNVPYVRPNLYGDENDTLADHTWVEKVYPMSTKDGYHPYLDLETVGQPFPGYGNSGSTDWSAESLAGVSLEDWKSFLQSAYDQQSALDEAERQFNSGEAQKNREWQEMMSSSAIQRQVADLEKAGLNKWLAVNGGSLNGSSTPSGSQASSSSGNQSVAQIVRAFLTYFASIGNTALRSILGIIDFF